MLNVQVKQIGKVKGKVFNVNIFKFPFLFFKIFILRKIDENYVPA